MKKTLLSLIFILALVGLGLPAAALDISAGLGRLKGDTTYRIGGLATSGGTAAAIQDPLSELEFPQRVL